MNFGEPVVLEKSQNVLLLLCALSYPAIRSLLRKGEPQILFAAQAAVALWIEVAAGRSSAHGGLC